MMANEKILIPEPLLRALIWIWGGALVLMCLLTGMTYVQTRIVQPLESPALAITLERIEKAPQNTELRKEFRALDLLARRAYFTTREQVRTGGLLIGLFALLLVITVKYRRYVTETLLPPLNVSGMEHDPAAARERAFKTVYGVAGGAAVVGLAFALLLDTSWTDPLRGGGGNSAMDDVPHNDVWQNFRGPGGWGVARSSGVPTFWNGGTGENIVWKQEVPKPGFSSPVIWKDRIFLTGADEKERVVMCFNFSDGALLWQQAVADTFEEVLGLDMPEDAGFAAPTPVVNESHVWAMFGTGMLACFTRDGELVWQKFLGAPDNRYGHSSSLMLRQGLVYVQYDHDGEANLFAFRALTGEKMWQQPRKEITWSSPVLAPTPTGAALIVTAVPSVDAYDASSGALLWSLPKLLRGEVGPSAAFNGKLIFITNEYAVTAGVDVSFDGSVASAKIAWENDDNLPSTSSPVADDTYLFLAGAEGEVTCHSVKDGKMLWDYEFDEGFYASPIIVDDRVYLIDRDGNMHVFACDDAYRSLGEPVMEEAVNATPAFVQGSIVIRGEKHLFRVGR